MANHTSSLLPPAVILGLSPTGLYAIRELALEGIPVTGVSSNKQIAWVSRYLNDYIIESNEKKRLNKLVQRFSETKHQPILIPTSDQDINFIIKYSDQLDPYFKFQSSYKNKVAKMILEKESFYQLCENHNIDYPKLWKSTLSDIQKLKNKISYPCIIKPSIIHDIKSKMAGQKGWIITNINEFDNITSKIPNEAGTLLLQEIIPGEESEITLYCAYFDGKKGTHQAFTCRKLRQYPPGFGSASMVQSCDEEETRFISEKFLNQIKYQGIAATEFKRDPISGKLKIIEINTRPSLWFSVSTAAGKKITLAAYAHLSGIDLIIKEKKQENGVRWYYFSKDLYSSLFYLFNKSFILPKPNLNIAGFSKKNVFAVFSYLDPLPSFIELVNFSNKLLRQSSKFSK